MITKLETSHASRESGMEEEQAKAIAKGRFCSRESIALYLSAKADSATALSVVVGKIEAIRSQPDHVDDLPRHRGFEIAFALARFVCPG